MQRTTKEIVLPQSQAKIYLQPWITGREAEYIQEPLFKAVRVNDVARATVENLDVDFTPENAVAENNRREVESWVAKIVVPAAKPEGKDTVIEDKAKIRDFILDEVPAADYEFVLTQIKDQQATSKKK